MRTFHSETRIHISRHVASIPVTCTRGVAGDNERIISIHVSVGSNCPSANSATRDRRNQCLESVSSAICCVKFYVRGAASYRAGPAYKIHNGVGHQCQGARIVNRHHDRVVRGIKIIEGIDPDPGTSTLTEELCDTIMGSIENCFDRCGSDFIDLHTAEFELGYDGKSIELSTVDLDVNEIMHSIGRVFEQLKSDNNQ